MSRTFSLVCHEKRKRVWIGQGRNGVMTSFYSGQKEIMAGLHQFLVETAGSPLVLICDDVALTSEIVEYDDPTVRTVKSYLPDQLTVAADEDDK